MKKAIPLIIFLAISIGLIPGVIAQKKLLSLQIVLISQ